MEIDWGIPISLFMSTIAVIGILQVISNRESYTLEKFLYVMITVTALLGSWRIFVSLGHDNTTQMMMLGSFVLLTILVPCRLISKAVKPFGSQVGRRRVPNSSQASANTVRGFKAWRKNRVG